MRKRMVVACGLMLAAAAMSATNASAQQFPGTNSMLTSPTTLTLMRTLGYAPTDYCGFYFYLSTSYQGRFSPDLLKALLPMCANWPTQQPPGGSGGQEPSGGGTTAPGTTGGSTGSGTAGGSTGGGSTEPGTTGGTGGAGGDDGLGGGNGGDGGWTGGNGGGDGWTGGTGADDDPFGGGSMATPEPISLILLGTGLAGIGGVRASRRRRRPGDED